jgi:hypothetical protein
MAELRRFLDEFWTGSLDRLQRLAESDQRESDQRESEQERKGTTHG